MRKLEPYRLHGRKYIACILRISERPTLRRHIMLLRKTEYHSNAGDKLIGELVNKSFLEPGINIAVAPARKVGGKRAEVQEPQQERKRICCTRHLKN